MTAQGYNFLEGSQTDINRRLLRKIQALESKVGSEDTDIGALETTVGDENSGLVKDVNTLKTTVGDADSGLVKSVAEINAAIGDEDTSGTILYRIKALEDAE